MQGKDSLKKLTILKMTKIKIILESKSDAALKKSLKITSKSPKRWFQ